jgi:hypothetical protein
MSRLTGALCANEDPDTFQSTHQSDHEEAAAICARCPVRVACLELAMALQATSPVGEQYGIQGTWGGVLYGATRKVGRPRKVKVQ